MMTRSPKKEDRKRERERTTQDDFKKKYPEKSWRPWVERTRQFKNVHTQTDFEQLSETPLSTPNLRVPSWYSRAEQIVNDLKSKRNEKAFNIFKKPFKTVEDKLKSQKLKTKASFKCAIEEIAEIALDGNGSAETETIYKAEYLKTYLRLHWDVHFERKTFEETEIAQIRRRMTRLYRKICPNDEQHIEPDLPF